jgi:hypothetical protein
VVAGAVVTQQVLDPTSLTRTTATRRRIMATHVARARADHEHLSSLRARVFPTTAVTGRKFDERARLGAQRVTAGYR